MRSEGDCEIGDLCGAGVLTPWADNAGGIAIGREPTQTADIEQLILPPPWTAGKGGQTACLASEVPVRLGDTNALLVEARLGRPTHPSHGYWGRPLAAAFYGSVENQRL